MNSEVFCRRDLWHDSIWISAADAAVRPDGLDPYHDRPEAEDGTACFTKTVTNPKQVAQAWWCVTGLGVFTVSVNGVEVGEEDFLKPGFTHFAKTKYAFSYDVTAQMRTGVGETNDFCGYVSAGWWRDKIVLFHGKRSAFRAVLLLCHPDGTETRIGTDTTWLASGAAGPVTHAAIFDGEDYDARLAARDAPVKSQKSDVKSRMSRFETFDLGPSTFNFHPAIENTEFNGEILPMAGPPVRLRHDLAMEPVEAYVWQGVEGADEDHFGRVIVRRTAHQANGEKREAGNHSSLVTRHSSLSGSEEVYAFLAPGETLILDFGQNCAAVPEFVFSAARGVTLTARPAEMLNDGNGDKARHCDGPGGSAYVAEYRQARTRVRYTFAGKDNETYHPHFTFFGGRYLSVTADGPVAIRRVRWIPVSSIAAEAETGFLETGDASINRFIQNVIWGQRSNYLSVPTDCPQRAERLGWTADTQIFAKAASYNADVRDFLRKWMRDMRDSQRPDGGFPGVAPVGMIGANEHQFGWADAGIIVPYTVWRHFGDAEIVRENWEAMSRYVALVDKMKFDSPQAREHQWADWLSLEKLETASGRAYVGGIKNVPPVKEDALLLWRYFGACYWLQDALMMAEMAKVSESEAVAPRDYRAMASLARSFIRDNFIDPSDGMLIPLFRDMQTPALFALRLGILDENPARATRDALLANIRDHGSCLQTGFLGTAMILDVLADQCDSIDVAYTLLLQHGFPSWLYSVDQGATTIWESWDAYTVAHGFSPGMRSFNHYAYGAIVAWMYRTMAGIREDPKEGGFRHFILSPHPDPRMERCTARYRSPCGEIGSSWLYDSEGKWIWHFAIPANTTATVIVPGESPVIYPPGLYEIACVPPFVK